MRTLTLCALAVILGSPVSAQICTPPDSAPLAEWHTMWDRVPPDSLGPVAEALQTGVIDISDSRNPAGSPRYLVIIGTYTLKAHLLQQGAADLVLEGRLRLGQPSPSGTRSFRGWLVGSELVQALTWQEADSLPIRGEFTPDGMASFRQEFEDEDEDAGQQVYVDVGGFSVTESTDDGLRGWWAPGGAVAPPRLGFYCGRRTNS